MPPGGLATSNAHLFSPARQDVESRRTGAWAAGARARTIGWLVCVPNRMGDRPMKASIVAMAVALVAMAAPAFAQAIGARNSRATTSGTGIANDTKAPAAPAKQ